MTFRDTHNSKSDGFVLPYVMLVIAILSFSLILIAQRVQNSSKILTQLEGQFAGRVALNSAEAETIYTLMISVPEKNGYELNPKEGLNLFDDRDEDKVSSEIWSAKGGIRQSFTPGGTVIVRLRDGSGYIPINSIDEQAILALTKSLGFATKKQQSLTAKLLDYIDEDSRRQLSGGERADYRLRQLPPPTNASLRKIGELNNVMEWKDLTSTIDYKDIIDRVTLNAKVKTVKLNFIEPSFAEELSLDFKGNRDIYELLKLDEYPTDVIRLTFYYRDFNRNIMRRKIEVDKTIAYLTNPFSSQLLYEDLLDATEDQSYLDQLFLNLDGEKHVIYAKAYRYK